MASKPCKICESVNNKLVINDTPPEINEQDLDNDDDEEEKENTLLFNNLNKVEQIINNKSITPKKYKGFAEKSRRC